MPNLRTTVTIRLAGCDETTSFDMDVTPEELDVLKRTAALSREASQGGCYPVMYAGEDDFRENCDNCDI